ncbi:MAG TPA: hypothetical protein VF092_17420 [Longimicrobium sp.]
MKKLSLKIDSLEVETFEPECRANDNRGTVEAYSGDPINCATYDPRDYRCYFSADLGGRDCTPVCYTADPLECGG